MHRRRIGRTFAIASKQVTRGQFGRFLKANPEINAEFDSGGQAARLLQKYAPEDDCPIILVDWYLAAAYCNWLSKEEGLPAGEWCYEPTRDGRYAEGMHLAPDYLKRTGYRLPMDAEWEYACRAGAATSRYYGESEELLPKYGWYKKNSAERTWPVGTLKPNDFGLFDMHGNVYCWCQESYRKNYAVGQGGRTIEDNQDGLLLTDKDSRVLRGGSFFFQASNVRCAGRLIDVPAFRFTYCGFRLARTLPLGSLTRGQ